MDNLIGKKKVDVFKNNVNKKKFFSRKKIIMHHIEHVFFNITTYTN